MSRLRITGGEWRSRLIKVVDAQGLRPTPDSVRETLFNWLGQDLSGLDCLDLFAGSGILGFEAASRGAASVTQVERDPRVFAALKENALSLSGDRMELVRADALKFTASAESQSRRYDVVFLDPPYRQQWLERIAPHLAKLAKPGMRVYAEAEHAVEHLADWRTVKHGRAGQVFYHLLERE
ncbi:MAG TPA: 16S rRNA (guanine(966)-N(2))-methyltransferase RsmD [Rhodocyclaceae bacterium]